MLTAFVTPRVPMRNKVANAKILCELQRTTRKNIADVHFAFDFVVAPDAVEIEGFTNGSVVEVPHEQETLNVTCLANNGKPGATFQWFRSAALRRQCPSASTAPQHSVTFQLTKDTTLTMSTKFSSKTQPRQQQSRALNTGASRRAQSPLTDRH